MLQDKAKEILQQVPTRLRVRNFNMLSLLFLILTTAIGGTAMAQGGSADDDWQFGIGVYGWGAFIGGETASGSDLNLDLDDILENLKFTAMGDVAVGKGKWMFMTDILYMDLEGDKDGTRPVGNETVGTHTDVELKAWIMTPLMGYTAVESEKMQLKMIGGARYLYLDTQVELTANSQSGSLYHEVSDSGSIWDAIIGVRGQFNLNDRWYIPYHLDIGTGDSDLTWQVNAGFGYKFDVCDVILSYRYLSWNFDDNPALDNLNINGPLLGVKFVF